jgi:hypothetical protein
MKVRNEIGYGINLPSIALYSLISLTFFEFAPTLLPRLRSPVAQSVFLGFI